MGHPFRQSLMARRDWRWWAAAVVVVQVSHFLWTLLSPMQGAALHWVANVFIDSSVVIAFVLVTAVATRYRGSRLGLAWALLALGLLFNLFAEVSWSVQELAFQDVPFPSVSDIGYVGAYFPVLLGLLLMPQAPSRSLSRVQLALDALIVTSALAVLSWFLIVESVLSASGEPAQAKALSVFYPFADLAVIFAAFVLVARVGRTRFALAFGLLAAGYVATAFADSVYAYLTEAGYSTGSYADIGWVAGYSLLSLAALTALDPIATFEPRTRHAELAPAFWPSLVPYVAVVPLAILLLDRTGFGGADTLLTAGFISVLALIVLRQVLANHENIRLNAELRDLPPRPSAGRLTIRTNRLNLQRRSRSLSHPPSYDRPAGKDIGSYLSNRPVGQRIRVSPPARR